MLQEIPPESRIGMDRSLKEGHRRFIEEGQLQTAPPQWRAPKHGIVDDCLQQHLVVKMGGHIANRRGPLFVLCWEGMVICERLDAENGAGEGVHRVRVLAGICFWGGAEDVRAGDRVLADPSIPPRIHPLLSPGDTRSIGGWPQFKPSLGETEKRGFGRGGLNVAEGMGPGIRSTRKHDLMPYSPYSP
jgi:hypothetical protein